MGTLATILSTVYDHVPGSLQVAALVTMGVFTAAAVMLVDSPPEERYGLPGDGVRPAGRRRSAARGRRAGHGPGRWRFRMPRPGWLGPRKVVPALPPRDALFDGRDRELKDLIRLHDSQRRARTTRRPPAWRALWQAFRRWVQGWRIQGWRARGWGDQGLRGQGFRWFRRPEPGQATGPVVLLIHGKPGVGKTALSDELARRLAPQYPHGQVFVNLGTGGAARTPKEILKNFLIALGWSESMPDSTVGRAMIFRSLTAKKKILFILDAARHADQVRHVMPSDPAAAVIVTSRRDLLWFELPPASSYALDLPDPDDALDIFRTVSGTDESTRPECAAEIVELCGRLPLAIRAAAERVSNDGTDICHIAGLLRSPRTRLTWLDQPGRPLRAHLQTEYDRLLPAEQRAFAALALVPSSTFVPWVLGPLLEVPAKQAEALIDRLAAAELLDDLGTDESSGVARYGFHPLVRLFAAERAAALPPDERAAAQGRLAEAYRDVITAVLDELDGVSRQRPESQWLPHDSTLPKRLSVHPENWVRAEYPNLLRVMELASNDPDHRDPALCWRIGTWLGGCVAAEVSPEETLDAYALAARAAEADGNDLGLVDVLLAKGTFLVAIERYRDAENCLAKAADLASGLWARTADRAGGDQRTRFDAAQRITVATRKLGEAYLQAACYRHALVELDRAFTMAEAVDDRQEQRLLQLLLADAHHVDTPDATYDHLLDAELPDATRFRVFLSLAEAARRRAEWRSAEDYLGRALRFVEGDLRRMATVRYRLARLLLDEHGAAAGNADADRGAAADVAAKAVRRAATAAVTFRQMHNELGVVRAHSLLTRAILAIGRPVEAEHMARTAEAELAALRRSGEKAEVLSPLAARLERAEGELRLHAGDLPGARQLMMESATTLGEHQDWAALNKVLRSLERLGRRVPVPSAAARPGGPALEAAVWSGRVPLPAAPVGGPVTLSPAAADGLAAHLGDLVAGRVQAGIRDVLVPPAPVTFRGAVGTGLAGDGVSNVPSPDGDAAPVWRVPVGRVCELTVLVTTGYRAFAEHERDRPALAELRIWLPFAVTSGDSAAEVDLTIVIDAPLVDVPDRRLETRCRVDGGLVRHRTTLRVEHPDSYDLRVALLSSGRLVQALPIELMAGGDDESDGRPDGAAA
ncbi:ATP-binding protein [Planosporangium mesophilum]|uniref:ATP-binding protein n=1 Tax=Planosporangium mesophilum TaxID=689768 RepID=UPI00143884A6|nr:ATP-binding protein [Planosporangium mesophilum]NJC84545.1 ATP-binding protein [Planosporangium mesophilum]